MFRNILILALMVVLLAACGQTPSQGMGDPARGSEIFHKGVNGAPACSVCHSTSQTAFTRGAISVAPNLNGLSQRAGSRVEGLKAQDYLFHSITQPSSFVVDGFQNLMYPKYADELSKQDVTDLIAYLMTL